MTNPSRILRVLTVSVAFILTAAVCDVGPVPTPTKVVMEGKLLDKSLSLTEAEQLFIKGVELNNQGLHRQAIKEYDKSIQLDPDFAMAYNNRAISYRDLGQYQRAIQDLTKAIQLDPDDAAAFNNRGSAYNVLNHEKRAIQDYDKAIQLDPDFAMAYYNRAISYRNIRERTKQTEDRAKACSLDSKYC